MGNFGDAVIIRAVQYEKAGVAWEVTVLFNGGYR